MALIIVVSDNAIEVALDGVTDFDSENDLLALGLAKNAPDGLSITKIRYEPSATDDVVKVRDGRNGPSMFKSIALGEYDITKDDFWMNGDRDKGRIFKPYIHANETVVSVENQAFIIFEL